MPKPLIFLFNQWAACWRTPAFSGLLYLAISISISAPAHAVDVLAADTWPDIYAGRETVFPVIIRNNQQQTTLLRWRVTYQERDLARGEQEVRASSDSATTEWLRIQTPAMKPDTAVPVLLDVRLVSESTTIEAGFTRKLTLHGLRSPAHWQVALRDLKIELIDPENQLGDTLKPFGIDFHQIPKHLYGNLSSYQTDADLILVAPETPLEGRNSLAPALLTLARQGKKILALQPKSGEFSFAGELADASESPSRIQFAGPEVVSKFAPGDRWPAQLISHEHRIQIQTRRNLVSASIAAAEQAGWDWLELGFSQSGGQLILCSLPLMRFLQQAPTADRIFGRLLFYASKREASSEF